MFGRKKTEEYRKVEPTNVQVEEHQIQPQAQQPQVITPTAQQVAETEETSEPSYQEILHMLEGNNNTLSAIAARNNEIIKHLRTLEE